MENRSIRHLDRNESALYQCAAETRHTSDERCSDSLNSEEVNLLIEFFQLLDRWDREVVQ